MKQKIIRTMFERKMFIDEPMDTASQEIYLEHVRGISKAYALAGTLQAAERKFSIHTLWSIGGPRPSSS